MNFKLVSKNNIGVVLLLLLAIFLSQSKMLNFLLNTTLGRSFLLVILLVISYINKILGVVGVLLIIVMFNNMDFYSLEGFEQEQKDDKQPTPEQTQSTQDKKQDKKQNKKPEAIELELSTTESSVVETENTSQDNVPEVHTNSVEGFDLLGTENSMKRGVQSNSIQVNQMMQKSDIVSPYENPIFSDFAPVN